MSDPIEFYFDFSSPYGYLAAECIDDLAARHGRDVAWRPYLMGVAMKVTGSAPLVRRPMVGAYSRHDMARSARRLKVPFRFPEPFPIATIAACRAVYWTERAGAEAAKSLARALYRAYFADGRNISEADMVADVAATSGADRDALLAGIQEPAIKDRLKEVTNAAVERGIFGSPFFVVDGEPFWGHDRMDEVERWLEAGGW